MYRRLSTLFKIAISIVIIAFLCYKASSDENFSRILNSSKRWEFLLLGQVFVLAGVTISFLRWRSLVAAVGIRFSRWDALRIGFIGHMFGSISIGTFGSDAIRVFYVSRENPTQKAAALTSVFVDRICGLLGLFTLTSLTMLIFQYQGHSQLLTSNSKALQIITWIALILTFAGFLGFASLFVLPAIRKSPFVRRLLAHPRFGLILEKLLDAGIRYQSKPTVLLIALTQSICVHTLLTLSIFCVAVGLTVPHPSFGDHFMISPISHLASVLPLPGGFGGLEGAMYFFYQSISNAASDTSGFLVALTYRIETLAVAGIGIPFYLRGKKEITLAITGSESSTPQTSKPEESSKPAPPSDGIHGCVKTTAASIEPA